MADNKRRAPSGIAPTISSCENRGVAWASTLATRKPCTSQALTAVATITLQDLEFGSIFEFTQPLTDPRGAVARVGSHDDLLFRPHAYWLGGNLSSVQLVTCYLQRYLQTNHSVPELNPGVLEIAAASDLQLKYGTISSPLDGIQLGGTLAIHPAFGLGQDGFFAFLATGGVKNQSYWETPE
ncbi:hypothetical protein LTR49_026845 [Elasticomyces elasticus]|nr:hypothetical protein LTR49_026845 [Elasticomyces elasticus]